MRLGERDKLGHQLLTFVNIETGLPDERVERSTLLDGAITRAVDVIVGYGRPVLARNDMLGVIGRFHAQIAHGLNTGNNSH